MGASHNMSTVLKNNRLLLGRRKRLHEHEKPSAGTYRKMEDHKQMKGHEFAAFQKEQFLRRKKERREQFMLRLAVILITFLIIVFFLWLYGVADLSSAGPNTAL
ncbi:MAG: hypothetical protein AAFP76_05400 [Bacteroidota bacterium]